MVDPLGLAGGGGLPQNGFGGAKNGSPGNPNGIDPAVAFLDSPSFRAGVGGGTILGGSVAMVTGAAMCDSGNPLGLIPLVKGAGSFVDGLIDYGEGLSGNGYNIASPNPYPQPPQPSPSPGRHSGPGYTPTPRPR
jgi:hypothetical protein